MTKNRVKSPGWPTSPDVHNPPEGNYNPLRPNSKPRPARMSSPIDPPNSGKRRANVNNEHDSSGDKGFGSIPPGR